MPDERWNELFAALRTNRGRAILALAVSNGARASEILGIRGADLDWGEGMARIPATLRAEETGTGYVWPTLRHPLQT
jgi:integrase